MSQVSDVELEQLRIIEEARLQEKEALSLEDETDVIKLKKQARDFEMFRLKKTIKQLRNVIDMKDENIESLNTKLAKLKNDHQEEIKNIERELLWKIKMKQSNAKPNLGKYKCKWCKKYFMESELTDINGLGKFCKECAEKRSKYVKK